MTFVNSFKLVHDLLYGTYVQYYDPNNIWLPATGLSCVIDFSKHDVK